MKIVDIYICKKCNSEQYSKDKINTCGHCGSIEIYSPIGEVFIVENASGKDLILRK